MITLLVFYMHIVGATYAFTKRFQEEGAGEGLLAVFFMGLIFFVGWSMSSFLLRLVMNQEGFGPWFDRDAASLVVLSVAEAALYVFFLRKVPHVNEKRL